MSALVMTLLRVGFLVLLWVFIYFVIRVLRRDLQSVHPSAARPEITHSVTAGPPPAPAARAGNPVNLGPTRLVVTEGNMTGIQVPLATSAILIGRSPSCTLVLDDDYSSSRHARIFPRADTWFVEDLGSTNGTYVGTERVLAPMPLSLGSTVRVGQSTLELQR